MSKRPMIFRRGGSFSATFTIPSQYADGYFAGWLPLAQVRIADNIQPDGLVATLEWAWEEANVTRKITVTSKDTSQWPAGGIQLDLLLTSPSGEYFRTDPIVLECVPGVTEVTS